MDYLRPGDVLAESPGSRISPWASAFGLTDGRIRTNGENVDVVFDATAKQRVNSGRLHPCGTWLLALSAIHSGSRFK